MDYNLTEAEREVESRMIFASSCVESCARRFGVSAREMYARMKRVDMINSYVFDCYDALHTESRENLTDDLADVLVRWEALKQKQED